MWPSRSTSTPHSTGVTAGLPPAGGQRQAVALERDQVLAGAGAAGVEGGLFGAGPGDQIGSGGGGLAIAGQAAGQLRGLAASEAHVDQAGQHAWVPVAGGVVGQAGADGLERDTGGDELGELAGEDAAHPGRWLVGRDAGPSADLRDVLREQRRRGNSVRSYRLLFSTCYREVHTGLLTTGAQPASGATSAFASFPQVSTLPGRVRFRHWPVSGQWCDLRLCVVVAGRWPAVAGALWRRDGQFVHDALPADAAVAFAPARTLPPGFRSRTGSISPWRMATVIR